MRNYKLFLATALLVFSLMIAAKADAQQGSGNVPGIKSIKTVNATTTDILLSDGRHMIIDFYGEQVFRLFVDSVGKSLRDPEARPVARILSDDPRRQVAPIKVTEDATTVRISSAAVRMQMEKADARFSIYDLRSNKMVAASSGPVIFENSKTLLNLKEQPLEYFYGGGVQNGRFSHKGKIIAIENQNSWTDGGVASPTPFYWSTGGYGLMWYTFKKGKYDFGAVNKGTVTLYHETDYLDLFFMVDDKPASVLRDLYQLTGNPVLLPKFAFYEGHLNAYNRDYWKEDTSGTLFEDGKKYKESQKDNAGIRESLNGERQGNYLFSARAVVDRYKNADMPLGWILPNDGYGAGYGQTGTLDSNVLNLKNFGDYARKNGVEIGLWTQSDLHPKPEVSALLQRDIEKEVRDAGVRVLKTDVAWVGPGYSFGLNGVSDAAQITSRYGNNARPFIISLDGWAGTQRYASIWSGDQTGGQWEYIRFHIPTYIGAGLGGQPNITSDMDGIFGGKNIPVNVRDFQWKTFTPMQLNMDGWGANPKYPQALNEPATSINRNYLKLKSELLPYTYSLAKQSVDGLPMIRAMFLEDSNTYTLGAATKYQYMYGPYFLVAPIYKNTKADDQGNDIRNGIYLPQGDWIDYFSGERYQGGRVVNYFQTPLWKLPVFVKPGAIIPLVNPHNNPSQINKAERIFELYPAGKSNFTLYDDDGTTEAYKKGAGVYTTISSELDERGIAVIKIMPAQGAFTGFVKEQTTVLKINTSHLPSKLMAKVGTKKVKLSKAVSLEDFGRRSDVYYYDERPDLNRFATAGSEFAKTVIAKNPQLLIKLAATDITKNPVTVTLKGYRFATDNPDLQKTGLVSTPRQVMVRDSNTAAFTLKPSWQSTANADFYEIMFNDMMYSHIKDSSFLFDELQPEQQYSFKLRAVNKTGVSDWVTFSAKTKTDPLLFAIKGIDAVSTAPSQGGEGVRKLFDFDEANNWHTKYGTDAVPFDIVMDLKGVNQLEKFQYLPRNMGLNGVITKGAVYYSINKKDWIRAAAFEWKRDNDVKEFVFASRPMAKYIKIEVAEGVGNFGSGRELYVFKVPGSASYIPGDINNDGKIDNNDMTSYTNYTGLRKGDGDYEGYISNGDINKNGLIDAFDISHVATELEKGAKKDSIAPLSGRIVIAAGKVNYKAGELIEVRVKGQGFASVNAFSFALPYDATAYEYAGLQNLQVKQMENLTYDRLHTNGSKALYPTFVNLGAKEALAGNSELFLIRFKAKKDLTFNLKAVDGIIVDRDLNEIKF